MQWYWKYNWGLNTQDPLLLKVSWYDWHYDECYGVVILLISNSKNIVFFSKRYCNHYNDSRFAWSRHLGKRNHLQHQRAQHSDMKYELRSYLRNETERSKYLQLTSNKTYSKRRSITVVPVLSTLDFFNC